ncbi:MAG: response regulator [Sterolibacterium sp.]|jgi:two-component system response regulator RegA|nr:response regulator [Sterolibacterium sp.]
MNPLTTLIIDDDEAFNSVLQRALTRRGHSAISAYGAAEALTMAERHQPDRIVLDLNLAGRGGQENGLSLIVPLKQLCPNSRIVLLTGYASIATAVDAIKLGATHYLAKPVDVDTLLTAFEQHGDAPESAASPPPSEPLSVDRLEWEHIQRVLLEHDGNISATARALKMHRRTLQRKLDKHPVKE